MLQPAHYEALIAAARNHADRDEVRPDAVVAAVRRVLADAVAASPRAPVDRATR
jgi:hypothetical protein